MPKTTKPTRPAKSPRTKRPTRSAKPRTKKPDAPAASASPTTIGLHNLRPAKGATQKRKRLGRGPGSGLGKTAGRGNKGFWSRSGSSQKRGFEGGQMPLHRRIPKRGFTNIFRKEYVPVNVDTLSERFPGGATVGPEDLAAARLVKPRCDAVKILGRGEIGHALTVRAHRFSAEARRKIEAAGGKAELL